MTAAITLVCPIAPSVNSLYANIPRRGRVISKTYKRWQAMAYPMLNLQRGYWPRLADPVRIAIECERLPPRRSSDISNRIKALEDALKACGFIVDDVLVQDIRIRWIDEQIPLPDCLPDEYEGLKESLARITLAPMPAFMNAPDEGCGTPR